MIAELSDYAGGLGRGWPTGMGALGIFFGVLKLVTPGLIASHELATGPPVPDPVVYTVWFGVGGYLVIVPPIRVYREYRALREELQECGVWDIVVEHAGEGWW